MYNLNDVTNVINESARKIFLKIREGKDIPRFSKKYETVVDYLRGETAAGRFDPNSSTGRRIMRAADEHPTFFTLDDARGHGKPTGKTFQFSDESGLIGGGVQFKNRSEESRYAKYLNAERKYLATGNDSELKKWTGKTFILKDGSKVTALTDTEVLQKLSKIDELPKGNDPYIH
ncbi:MAG: hypothetical protein M0Z41_16010 [Peptococcaceae bacterium]|jgi:hypothetical protein|nr:hypothetical protein [Peptococcaceae bacterium]